MTQTSFQRGLIAERLTPVCVLQMAGVWFTMQMNRHSA